MIKTTTSSIEVDSMGVIENTFKTRSAFKPAYVLEQANTIRQLLNGKKALIIVNVLKVDQIKFVHYSRLLEENNLENATAMAFLVNSVFQKKAFNIWYGMKKKNCPVMAFTNKEEALVWLKSHAE
ncbi:MAG: hypothetical protein ACKOXB_14045 [Flavobacteriales bacterium]